MNVVKLKKLINPPESDFPTDVLKWMKFNAKPTMALKLMQCCKYFQHKTFPFIAVDSMNCSKYHKKSDSLAAMCQTLGNIDEKDFYVTDKFIVTYSHQFYVFLPKIAICKARIVKLQGVVITWPEFSHLTISGQVSELILQRCEVIELVKTSKKNRDPSAPCISKSGKQVSLEKLFKMVPKIEYFFYEAPDYVRIVGPNFCTTALRIMLPQLEECRLYLNNIKEGLRFQTFMERHPAVIYIIRSRSGTFAELESFQQYAIGLNPANVID